MKNKNTSQIVLVILLIPALISCTKDDSPLSDGYDGPIIQKWNIVRHIDTTYYFYDPFTNTTTYLDYEPTTHSDYLDFKANGMLYRFENGIKDTSTFTLSNDTLIVTHKHFPLITVFKIEVSTTDSLQISGMSHEIITSHDYRLTHYYLNN